MKKFIIYSRTQSMRLLKVFPASLLIILVITAVISALTAIRSLGTDSYSGDEKARIQIGIVGAEDSPRLKAGLAMLKTADSSRQSVNFQAIATKDEALEHLRAGDLTAVILIPDGILDLLLSGDTSGKLILYLRSAQQGMGPVLIRELSLAVSTIILEMEHASYALYDFYTQSGVTNIDDINAAQTDLLLLSLTKILDRNELFSFREIVTDSSVSIQSYYLLAAVFLVIMLSGVILSGTFIRSDDTIPVLIRVRLLSSPWQVLAEFTALLIHISLLMAICFLISGAGLGRAKISFPELERGAAGFYAAFLRLSVGTLPVIILSCALDLLIYELSDNLLSGLMVHFLLVIVLSFLSGVFFPLSSFPEGIRNVLRLLPTAKAMEYLRLCLIGHGSRGPMIYILMCSGLFLAAAGGLRRLRILAHEQAL